MADKRLRTMVFPGLEDTYTIPQDMNDLESIEAVAEPYDEFTAYAIGDYCSNGGKLYRCNTAIPSGETWNANHWTETNVGDEILAEKAATSTALSGKVSKAGDTMTGNLTIHNSNPSLFTKSTIIDTTETSSASTYTENIGMVDINNRYLVYLQGAMLSNGTIGLTLSPRRFLNGANVDNGISLSIRNDGSKTVSLGAPAAWRDALGLGSVETGESGANLFTVASGFTLTEATCYKWGHVVEINLNITKTTAVTTPTFFTLGTIKVANKCPITVATAGSTDSALVNAYVLISGQVNCYVTSWAANTSKRIMATYISP